MKSNYPSPGPTRLPDDMPPNNPFKPMLYLRFISAAVWSDAASNWVSFRPNWVPVVATGPRPVQSAGFGPSCANLRHYRHRPPSPVDRHYCWHYLHRQGPRLRPSGAHRHRCCSVCWAISSRPTIWTSDRAISEWSARRPTSDNRRPTLSSWFPSEPTFAQTTPLAAFGPGCGPCWQHCCCRGCWHRWHHCHCHRRCYPWHRRSYSGSCWTGMSRFPCSAGTSSDARDHGGNPGGWVASHGGPTRPMHLDRRFPLKKIRTHIHKRGIWDEKRKGFHLRCGYEIKTWY